MPATHTTIPRVGIRLHRERIGLILAFAAIVFGGSYSALAKGLTGYLSPISLLLVSEGLTAIFIALTLGIVPLVRAMRRMTRRELGIAALIGVLNSGIAPLLWFAGLQRTTAVNASLLIASDMLFMLALGYLLLKERINCWQGLGAGIVLTGIVVINLAGGGYSLSLHGGDLLVLAGVGVFSLGAVLFKRHLSHISAEAAIFVRCVAGIACVLPLALVIAHPFVQEIAAFPLEKIAALLAFGFFARFLHLTLFYEALDRLPAVQIGLIDNAMPLAGVLSAVVILGEPVLPHQGAGAVLILFGLFLEQLARNGFPKHERRARFHVGH